MWRALYLLMLLSFAGTSVAAEIAATVMFSMGSVAVENAAGVKRPAVRGGQVMSGDTIDTGGDGRVQLRFLDGASLSLTPGSRFRIDEYRFSGTGSREDKGFFSLLRGGLRTVSGLIGKQFREQYRVKTAVATIGIRGTTYVAQIGDEGLRVNTVQGLVEVCNQRGCVQIGPGETASAVASDQKPIRHTGSAAEGSELPPATPAAPLTQPELAPTGQSPGSTAEPVASPPTAPPQQTAPPSYQGPMTAPPAGAAGKPK